MDHVQVWERNYSPLLRSFHMEAPLTRTQGGAFVVLNYSRFPIQPL
jgi:hypothetical protein